MDDGELERGRLAVEQTSADDPRRPERMADLGALWRRTFLASGDITELDRAIGYFRGALGAAGTALAATEYNLAVLLSDRYDALGEATDLAAAMEAARRALDALIALYQAALGEPADGPAQVERAMIASNLGDALLDRAAIHELVDERPQAGLVYRQALAAHEEAVAATPLTAPDRPGRLNKLAVVQRALADRTSAQADIDAARASFREACRTGLLAAPEMALAAAGNWLTWEVARKDWRHAVVADGYAVRAADGLHRSQQRRAHRETWLLESRGLAAEAARLVRQLQSR